jgi:hypothetical protein
MAEARRPPPRFCREPGEGRQPTGTHPPPSKGAVEKGASASTGARARGGAVEKLGVG